MTWEPADFMWLRVGGVFGDLNSELAVGLDARKKIIYDADETYPEGKKATGNGRSVLLSIWFSLTTEAQA